MNLSKAFFALMLAKAKGTKVVDSNMLRGNDGGSIDGDEKDFLGVRDALDDGDSAENQEGFFGCRRDRNMCQSCSRDCACVTGLCSWNFVCYDQNDLKGDNGCGCTLDSNCKSGRCATDLTQGRVRLTCEEKLEEGERCLEPDDCKSNRCDSNGIEHVCLNLCHNPGTIPFMVTNVNLKTDPQGKQYWDYHPRASSPDFKFLKQVTHCPDAGLFGNYRIYGEVVPDATTWQNELEAYLRDTDTNADHVLYAMHGVNVDPRSSFNNGYDFREDHEKDTKYVVIPINWRNVWGSTIASYEISRNHYAPDGGNGLAEAFGYFSGASYSQSIVVHSMGNYVFRHFAQAISNPQEVFQNVFMVAADERSDMFSPGYNPSASPTGSDEESIVLDEEVYLEIPGDEFLPDGGFDISQLTNHTHVLWNKNDDALAAREAFQIGGGVEFRNALGKFGDRAEAMTAPYFKERVTYHDFTHVVTDTWLPGDAHGYQFEDPAVNLYEGYKFQKGSAPPTKVETGGGCTGNEDCFSGFCESVNTADERVGTCQYGPGPRAVASLSSM